MLVPLLRQQDEPFLTRCLIVFRVRIPRPQAQQCTGGQDLLAADGLIREAVRDTLRISVRER